MPARISPPGFTTGASFAAGTFFAGAAVATACGSPGSAGAGRRRTRPEAPRTCFARPPIELLFGRRGGSVQRYDRGIFYVRIVFGRKLHVIRHVRLGFDPANFQAKESFSLLLCRRVNRRLRMWERMAASSIGEFPCASRALPASRSF